MTKEQKEEIEFIILKIKECSYLNKKIININNQLEEINTQLVGVSSPSVKPYIIENKKPYSHHNRIELIMKEEELLKRRETLVDEIMRYDSIVQALDDDVRDIVIDLYILKKRHEDVARKYYYTRAAMYKKINLNLLKVTM